MLNENQREAVETISGPVVIRAGAGCGKTLTITHRVAHMINAGIKPSQILLLTFTKAAANEMKKRTAKILNEMGNFASIKEMQVSTFHSFARKTLMEYIDFSPLRNIKDLKWSDEGLNRWYLEQILMNYLGATGDKESYNQFSKDTGSLLRMISDVREAKKSIKEFTPQFEKLYTLYDEHLKSQGKVDFSGALLYLNKLLDNDSVRDDLESRYRYVMIDEFQDTNKRMFSILIKLTRKLKNLCVVGDENQSIYGFNGSSPEYIVNFKKYFPEAKVILLSENYRSASQILGASNNLMTYNENSDYNFLEGRSDDGKVEEKEFTNAKTQAKRIAEEIADLISNGEKPEDFAVLSRTNKELEYFLNAIREEDYSFLFRKKTVSAEKNMVLFHLLDHLKLVFNYVTDDELFEIMTRYNGMFHYTLRNLFLQAKKSVPSISAFEFLGYIDESYPVPKYVLYKIRRFYELISQVKNVAKLDSSFIEKFLEILVQFIDQTNGYDEIEAKYGKSKGVRYNNYEGLALLRIVKENEMDYRSVFDFFERIEEILDEEEMPKDKVTLLTIHASKGLEWKHVYILNCYEDSLPYKSSFSTDVAPFYFGESLNKDYGAFLQELEEEERRLCYVGMTRAKKKLNLCVPRNRYQKKGEDWKTLPNVKSRFLIEAKKMNKKKKG